MGWVNWQSLKRTSQQQHTIYTQSLEQNLFTSVENTDQFFGDQHHMIYSKESPLMLPVLKSGWN